MIAKVLKHTETATAACMSSNIVVFGSSALLNLIASIYRQTIQFLDWFIRLYHYEVNQDCLINSGDSVYCFHKILNVIFKDGNHIFCHNITIKKHGRRIFFYIEKLYLNIFQVFFLYLISNNKTFYCEYFSNW